MPSGRELCAWPNVAVVVSKCEIPRIAMFELRHSDDHDLAQAVSGDTRPVSSRSWQISEDLPSIKAAARPVWSDAAHAHNGDGPGLFLALEHVATGCGNIRAQQGK